MGLTQCDLIGRFLEVLGNGQILASSFIYLRSFQTIWRNKNFSGIRSRIGGVGGEHTGHTVQDSKFGLANYMTYKLAQNRQLQVTGLQCDQKLQNLHKK